MQGSLKKIPTHMIIELYHAAHFVTNLLHRPPWLFDGPRGNQTLVKMIHQFEIHLIKLLYLQFRFNWNTNNSSQGSCDRVLHISAKHMDPLIIQAMNDAGLFPSKYFRLFFDFFQDYHGYLKVYINPGEVYIRMLHHPFFNDKYLLYRGKHSTSVSRTPIKMTYSTFLLSNKHLTHFVWRRYFPNLPVPLPERTLKYR